MIHNINSPTAINSRPPFRFGMWTLLGAVVALSILLAVISRFVWRSATAKQQLIETCQQLGGYVTTGQVNMDLYVGLDGCHLSQETLQRLPQLWSQCVGEFWQPAKVTVTLGDAKFDGDPLVLFTENLVSITGPGIPLEDAGLEKILALSPHLWHIDLCGSRVSERALLKFLNSHSRWMTVEIDRGKISQKEIARIMASSAVRINEH